MSGSVVLGSHHGDQHCHISSAFVQQVVRTTQSMMAEQFLFRPHAHSFSVQCIPTHCKLDCNTFQALLSNTPRPCIAADTLTVGVHVSHTEQRWACLDMVA